MKKIWYIFLGLLIQTNLLSAQQAQPRMVINFDAQWTFDYNPSGVMDTTLASPAFDDSKWQAIALPHTWMTYETTGDIHPFIKHASEKTNTYWWYGYGWYRKKFTIDPALKNKSVSLEFDGVQKVSWLYINGNLVNVNKGGYNSFDVDIARFLKFGKENTIAMAVSGKRNDEFRTPPMTAGNFNVYGGIYRNVRLIIKNQIHIPFQGSFKHEGGTFVTTPFVNREKAVVNVRTFVKNISPVNQSIVLETIILDRNDRVIRKISSENSIPAGEMSMIEQETDTVRNPDLWSPQTPVLYKVISNVYAKGKLVDSYTSPLGFRWFKWDYVTNELIVNDTRIHINGTNRHQEYPWLGDAIPIWMMKMDMDDIRHNLGHNFMRTAHYPNDPYIYDYNDASGIIIVEEVPNIKNIDFNKEIQEENVRSMVRRDRNHPSIFFWSVGNESRYAADSKWVHEEDTTRIIHQRKTSGYGDFTNHSDKNLDMENMLRVTIRGWTDDDTKNLHPDNKTLGNNSGQLAGNEVHQHKMARVDGGSVRGRVDKNTVAWLYEDHGADREYKNAPLKNVNAKGWVDLYRVPKYIYYLWQANYCSYPMVFIQPHFWKSAYIGQKKSFQVDSNCDEVELFVNGKSKGKKYPTKDNFFTVEFDGILIEKGKLSATARNEGKEVAQWNINMADSPAKISLKTDQKEIVADRSGLAIIMADIVDMEGNHVYGATNTLKWEISGDGTLVGPPVYQTDFDKDLADEGCGYIDAPVANLVRATNKAGMITVRVSSPGLEPAEIKVQTIKPIPDESERWIMQPELLDKGRDRVTKGGAVSHEKVKVVEEIKPIPAGKDLLEGKSQSEFRTSIQQYIIERNQNLDTSTIEFKFLADALTESLVKMKGEIITDDYNFMARAFNSCRMISHAIDAKDFSAVFRDALKTYFADKLIKNGIPADILSEIERVQNIPGDIKIIMLSGDNQQVEYDKDLKLFVVGTEDLKVAIKLLDPKAKSVDDIIKKSKKFNFHVNFPENVKGIPIALLY